MPMIKNSTINSNIKDLNDEIKDALTEKAIETEFEDVITKLNKLNIHAPQKSVNFICNFSKAYKIKKLKNGCNTEMIIN